MSSQVLYSSLKFVNFFQVWYTMRLYGMFCVLVFGSYSSRNWRFLSLTRFRSEVFCLETDLVLFSSYIVSCIQLCAKRYKGRHQLPISWFVNRDSQKAWKRQDKEQGVLNTGLNDDWSRVGTYCSGWKATYELGSSL